MKENRIQKTEWVKVASVDTIPVQEGRRVYFEGKEFALFNLGGEFSVLDGHCPHKQGPLADGLIAGKAVFCPLHNWKISLTTGCAMTYGPGQVKVYPTKVVGKDVYVAFNGGSLCEPEESAPVVTNGESDMKVANQ